MAVQQFGLKNPTRTDGTLHKVPALRFDTNPNLSHAGHQLYPNNPPRTETKARTRHTNLNRNVHGSPRGVAFGGAKSCLDGSQRESGDSREPGSAVFPTPSWMGTSSCMVFIPITSHAE
ncbi:hypothetical protein V8C37DRAFT_105027 [Trichoderma ceciliae]